MRGRNLITLWAAVAAAVVFAVVPVAYGDNVFEGNIDTDWNTAGNWDNGVLPGADNETVNIYDSFTVDLSTFGGTTGTGGLRVGNSELGETATLNIYAGASLDVDVINGTNDIILGREDTVQSGSKGVINQMGGDVTVGDYIKISGDKATAAGGLYRISGGSLLVLDQLQMGRDNSVSTLIKFEVVGTGPTSIEIPDIKVERNQSAQATFSFVIDAGGVTPITVTDELQLGNNETTNGNPPGEGDSILELSLSAVPPLGDIVLFEADRITMDEQFAGLPDESLVTASFGGQGYGWKIRYYDSADDGTVIPAVVLTERRLVPEPASLTLIGMGAVLLVLARRRRA